MLWMYAECARAAQDPPDYRDPLFSIFDFLLTIEIESMEAKPLFDQADRLFECRFCTGGPMIPVIDPSFVRRADDALRLPQVVARSSRLGHSGSRLPGHRYESSRHGLAASRPRTPGSGASAVTPPPTKPSSRLGTRHIVRCNAVVRSAPLPVRHPGPRVTVAGRCTPARPGRPRLHCSQVNATHRTTRRAPS